MIFKKLVWEGHKRILLSDAFGKSYIVNGRSFYLRIVTHGSSVHDDLFFRYSSLEEAKEAAQAHHDEWVRKTFFVTTDHLKHDQIVEYFKRKGYVELGDGHLYDAKTNVILHDSLLNSTYTELESAAEFLKIDFEDMVKEIERIEA